MLVRGLISASGARWIAFSKMGVDTFDGRFDDLHPEAREGWERVANLMGEAPMHLLVPRDPPSIPPAPERTREVHAGEPGRDCVHHDWALYQTAQVVPCCGHATQSPARMCRYCFLHQEIGQ